MQELAQAIAARLIVTPSQSFNGMAIGSVEPTSNVGLWFKNCEELFVYDDATGRYVPLTIKGAFQSMTVMTSSGSFTVPEFISRIKVTAWGGGGGGYYDATLNPQGGGGGGGRGVKIFSVLPGQVIPVTIGMGGIAGNPATDGGNTTFLTMTAGGGRGGISGDPVLGGVVTGADFGVQGGTSEHPAPGGLPGFGGLSPGGGSGGAFSNVPANVLIHGIIPGGGGSGGYSTFTGGNGANGIIQIEF